MMRKALLAVVLCAHGAMAATFGPEMPVADLRAGSPTGVPFVDAWAESGNVVVIVSRQQTPARTTLRADGTADPSSLVALPISAPIADVTARLGGMMAVWSDGANTFAAPLDNDGHLLASPAPIPIAQPLFLQVRCNDEHCLVDSNNGAAIVDDRGNPVAQLDGPVNLGFAAGKETFLVSTRTTITLLDNNGGAVAQQSGTFLSAIFDGTRYVMLQISNDERELRISTVDPESGASSAPAAIVKNLPFEIARITDPLLAWNGTMYLVMMTLSSLDASSGPSWFSTLRVTPSLVPFDPEPQKQAVGAHVDRIVAAPDGFHLFWNGTEQSAHTALFSPGTSTIAPPLPNGQPLIRDRSSQFFAAAAAASRSAILGVYRENDGEHLRLLASRLGANPIVLQTDRDVGVAAAASDGDGFLVVWDEAGAHRGATIDAGGNVHAFDVGSAALASRHISAEFIGGAYRVAFVSDVVDAATIGSDGTVLQQQRTVFGDGTSFDAAALFDGTRTIIVWSDRFGVWSTTRQLLSTNSAGAVALLRDGDGFLAFAVDGASGKILSASSTVRVIPGPTLLPELVRIDGIVHAAYVDDATQLHVVPLDGGVPVTFDDGDNRRLFGGLLVHNAKVPIASGVATQMTVAIVHATTPRRRAAAKP